MWLSKGKEISIYQLRYYSVKYRRKKMFSFSDYLMKSSLISFSPFNFDSSVILRTYLTI